MCRIKCLEYFRFTIPVHHTWRIGGNLIPREFMSKWGLNINNPQLMQWWSKETHQLFAYEYNQAWRQWLDDNKNAKLTDVLDFGRKMMDEYGLTRNF